MTDHPFKPKNLNERSPGDFLKNFFEQVFNSRLFNFATRLIMKVLRYIKDRTIYYYYFLKTGGFEVSDKHHTVWQEKWRKPSVLKVLMFAPVDYAGSFYGWTTAVNRYSPDSACRLMSLFRHRYQYDSDLIFHAYDRGLESNETINRLVDESDILHLKDEIHFHNSDFRPMVSRFTIELIERFRKKNKPIVFTHYGSIARRLENDKDYQKLVLAFDARVALTPDLNYEWFNGFYIPHAVDVSNIPYLWNESKIFAHSPSKRALKGSEQMLKALSHIDEIQNNWTIDIIENVSHEKCLQRKVKAELFFDQAGTDQTNTWKASKKIIGWYGRSAVEAMMYGIPTIAHLSEIALKRSKNAGKDIHNRCPILNTGLDEKSMRDAVLKYLEMTSENKRELSLKTRQWVEQFHGEAVVGKELAQVYQSCV